MKNKIITITFLLLILAIAGYLAYDYGFDLTEWNFSNFSLQRALLWITVISLTSFLFVIFAQTFFNISTVEKILRMSIFIVSFLATLFLSSINFSIGQGLQKLIPSFENSECTANLDFSADSPSDTSEMCEVVAGSTDMIIALIAGFIFSVLLIGLLTFIRKKVKIIAYEMRLMLFSQSLIWFLILDVFVRNYSNYYALAFINIFLYTLIAYFLITTNFKEGDRSEVKEIQKIEPSEAPKLKDSENDENNDENKNEKGDNNENETSILNITAPRF